MKIAAIHLSDAHFDCTNNPIFHKTERMCQSIRDIAIEVEDIFVMFTGDIAYSGSVLEYQKASEFIDSVKARIRAYSGKKAHIIMVPGNHDCNFAAEENEARQTLVRNVRENGDSSINESVIKNCCQIQRAYFDLMKKHSDADNIVFSGELIWVIEYCFGAYNIIFNCYNTAWVSEPKEEPGKIHFPIRTFPEGRFLRRSNLTLAIMHHSLNWLNPTNLRDFSNHLENTSHIIFAGHEHVSAKSMKDNLDGVRTYFINGKVLQDKDQAEDSSFNVVIFDLSQENHKIYQYEWSGASYVVAKKTEWLLRWSPKFGQVAKSGFCS